VDETVKLWMGVAGRTSAESTKLKPLSYDMFSDFCANRQQPVRKLLHACSLAVVEDALEGDMSEVVNQVLPCALHNTLDIYHSTTSPL